MMRQYELVERVLRYDPKADEALLNRAYVYAMRAHGNQKRASGDPYFSHPLEVAAILTELKLDDATIATALLHDVIEDTEATRAEIDQLFGPEIGVLVDGLTKIKRLDLVSKKAEQAENFRKLLVAISTDIRVLLVKLADRLHNMRTLEHMKPESRQRNSEETLEIYAPLAGRMGMQALREELEELAFRWLHPEAYRTVRDRLDRLSDRNEGLVDEIRAAWSRSSPRPASSPRSRGARRSPIRSGARWRTGRSRSSSSPTSTAFASSAKVEDCYRVLGVVHTTWRAVPGRFKDYISTPKQNGYQSIHTTVVGPRHQRVELQLRTRAMHVTAEYGVAAHALYKDLTERAGANGKAPAADTARDHRPLYLAAPAGRDAARGRQPGGIPRAHQARAVPGSGVLLHAEGPPDRAAAGRDADRFRLCGAHRRRQLLRRRQHQRPPVAADDAAAQRRRGPDHHVRKPTPPAAWERIAVTGKARCADPPRGARCAAAPVRRARPAPDRLRVRQDRR